MSRGKTRVLRGDEGEDARLRRPNHSSVRAGMPPPNHCSPLPDRVAGGGVIPFDVLKRQSMY